jgi:hypothetical protein
MSIEKLHKAVFALYPNIIAVHGGDIDSLEAIDKTEKNIVIDKNAVLNWQDPNEYKYQRAKEYPSLADFADAYYWMQKGQTDLMDEYVAKCDAVKNKFPKETT